MRRSSLFNSVIYKHLIPLEEIPFQLFSICVGRPLEFPIGICVDELFPFHWYHTMITLSIVGDFVSLAHEQGTKMLFGFIADNTTIKRVFCATYFEL